MRMASPTLAWREKSALSDSSAPSSTRSSGPASGKDKTRSSSWVLLFRRRTLIMWGFTTVEVCVLSVSTALARLQDGWASHFQTRPARELSMLPFR